MDDVNPCPTGMELVTTQIEISSNNSKFLGYWNKPPWPQLRGGRKILESKGGTGMEPAVPDAARKSGNRGPSPLVRECGHSLQMRTGTEPLDEHGDEARDEENGDGM
jgi:hypothetical protein